MNNLFVSSEAQDDLRSIKEYISNELDNPSAANRTLSNITKRIRSLEIFPEIGASLSTIVGFETAYRFLVSENYLIIYKYVDKLISVVRIFFGKRDYIAILFGEIPDNKTE